MSLQETIIQELGVKPVIDAQEEIRRSIDFLKRYLKKHPFLKTFVLGISGGQDSTLAGRLAQLTMEELRAKAQYQLAIYMLGILKLVTQKISNRLLDEPWFWEDDIYDESLAEDYVRRCAGGEFIRS